MIEAHHRGVEIIWITDNIYGLEEDLIEDIGFFSGLQEAGIFVITDFSTALMHNKFAVFDDDLVWTGSTNFTNNGFNRNNNNVLWIKIVWWLESMRMS